MKKTLLILSVSILIFLAGCTAKKQTTETFDGLKMSFVNNAPPSTVTVRQSFPIYVDVENFGDYTINKGKAIFYLQGIGNNLKDYSSRLSNSIELVGKKETITGRQRLIFANAAYSDLDLKAPFTFDMKLTSCYDYATITQVELCVAKQSGVCTLEGNKINDNSNTVGPIKITSLMESVEGNTLKIEFVLSNVEKGKVYMPETNCDALIRAEPGELTKENYVKININDAGLGLSCRLLDNSLSSVESLDGYANLGKVICTKKLTDENFPSIIRISTSYKYLDSITKSLTISP